MKTMVTGGAGFIGNHDMNEVIMCTIYKPLKYEFLERIRTIHTEKPTHNTSHGLTRAALRFCADVRHGCGVERTGRKTEAEDRSDVAFEELKERGLVER